MQFTPKAFSNGVDVTVDVGYFTWLISDPTVAQISTGGLAVSRNSGVAYVTAAVDAPNGTFSEPFALVVCPVQSVTLSPLTTTNAQSSFYALSPGDKVTWLADARDTVGNSVSIAPITFSSSRPATATFTSSGLIQGTLVAQAPGFSSIGAACTPPRCNGGPTGMVYTSKDGPRTPAELGFGFPIYSNIATLTVSGTTSSNVYVTGNQLPGGQPNTNTQLRVFDTVALKLLNTINLPYVPNSLVFDPTG